jgi:citrate lyase subunit alpha/citrate CoA-transferase
LKLDTTVNSIGRRIPRSIPGLGDLAPFDGAFARLDGSYLWSPESRTKKIGAFGARKLASNLAEAIKRSGLQDGMTISFHHHLRNGDAVLPTIIKAIEELGIKGLTLAPSSLTDAHEIVADAVRRGTIARIHTSGVRGEIGRMISRGEMEIPVMIHSHGGRARAIEEGRISVDVAFLGAPTCDTMGNMTGSTGKSACGTLGYAQIDARNAGHVIAVTDNLVEAPLPHHISIPQYLVDQIVLVDSLGDASRIASGPARISKDPVNLRIAENAFDLIRASGLLVDGCSFQVGAGGASLAVAKYVRDYMRERSIQGGFGIGGITGYMADMLGEGLFRALFDVQSFDAAVTESVAGHPNHVEIDASWYANPFRNCVVNDLDVVVLAALDVDVDFNVDVLTGHDGILRGASGGHSDTAAGSKLSIITIPSIREGVPSIRDQVQTVVTPGETVDAIVTERGICINPRREDLAKLAKDAGLPVKDIGRLKAEIENMTGVPDPVEFDDEIVGVVEYRDGTIVDSIRKVR